MPETDFYTVAIPPNVEQLVVSAAPTTRVVQLQFVGGLNPTIAFNTTVGTAANGYAFSGAASFDTFPLAPGQPLYGVQLPSPWGLGITQLAIQLITLDDVKPAANTTFGNLVYSVVGGTFTDQLVPQQPYRQRVLLNPWRPSGFNLLDSISLGDEAILSGDLGMRMSFISAWCVIYLDAGQPLYTRANLIAALPGLETRLSYVISPVLRGT